LSAVCSGDFAIGTGLCTTPELLAIFRRFHFSVVALGHINMPQRS